jgi:hypothetical protein
MMLDVALSYFRRGIPVFPVGLPSKRPLNHRGHLARVDATEALIREWWTKNPDAAIGAVPIDQNAVVIDIDNGWDLHPETVAFVESLPPTRTARTMSGGRHLWYETYLEFSNSKPFPCIDIRSANGYVVMPPSAGYTWTSDTVMAELPAAIASTLHKASAGDPERQRKHVGADTPAMRKTAIDYLKYVAPKAIMGQGGDSATFEVASELVRNIGLSDELALELLLKHWNPFKAMPPWDDSELRTKVWNAGEYGKAAPGSERYPTSIPGPLWATIKDLTVRDWLARDVPAKEPVIGPINADSRVKLAGPTGLGKTHLALAIGAHVAAGKPFLNWPVHGARKVMYFDGEMPLSLLKERLQAAQQQLFSPADKSWQDIFWLYSTIDTPAGGLDTEAGMSWVEQKVALFEPALVIFDNVVALTEGDDNSNGKVAWGSSWANMLPMIKRLTGARVAQIWVDHSENGHIVGAKKNSYQLDTEIMMRPVEDAEGVQFDLWFGKTRERTPHNAALYEAGRVQLLADKWSWVPEDDVATLQIKRVLKDADGTPSAGWKMKDMIDMMAETFDMTKVAAKGRLNRARNRGLVADLVRPNGNSYLWKLP